MDFVPMALEKWRIRYERSVAYNLADPGVPATVVAELCDTPSDIERLLNLGLGYPAVGGTPQLRELVAAWHGTAQPDSVLVTVGAAEANFVAVTSLIRPGDHVVVTEPAYEQVRGCALNAGARLDTVPLDPARGWRIDPDALRAAVTPGTRMIAITNPNNPTGAVLSAAELDVVVDIAQRAGAFLLVDEVFRGTELSGDVTPTCHGRYDRALVVGGLSKVFGLPGLRIGWLVAAPALIESARRRHEYAAIATSTLSMHLAEIALRQPVRDRLIARGRSYLQTGQDRLRRWVDESDGMLSMVAPRATAFGFVHYDLDIGSVDLAERIRAEADVLLCAGTHFGLDRHLRICHGQSGDFEVALARVAEVLGRLRTPG